MKRNFSGSILALLFVAVIAMKQVALGFCLCTASFHFDDSCCDYYEDTTTTSTCGSDCGCPDENHPIEDLPLPQEHPCNDCNTTVSLDAGDFFWSTADDLQPDFITIQEVTTAPSDVTFLRAAELSVGATSSQGSPPESCARYLRLRSLRL